jgi:hypothetical protein
MLSSGSTGRTTCRKYNGNQWFVPTAGNLELVRFREPVCVAKVGAGYTPVVETRSFASQRAPASAKGRADAGTRRIAST